MDSPSTSPIRAAFDLHCHILPAWDDGPKSVEQVLRMIERARKSGIETIVATPHVGRAFKGVEHSATSIPEGVKRLQEELDAREIKIKIVPGAEILLGSVDLLSNKGVLPEWTVGNAGKYVLVESPYRSWPDFGNNLLYELMLRGVRPIIAHPERYVDVQKDISKIEGAVSQGALLQITAGSVLGQTGKEMSNCSARLLDAGWVHLVASDAHNSEHAWPGETIQEIQKKVGEARARQIFEDNPRAILAGNPIPVPVPLEKKEKSGFFLSRLLRGNRA
ncbi:MAG TPA: CpsB/CapC family capsule biosynthesis tyrosine phosphatase [Abditibacterium sp.]|jgi:protein-tyrosine phosphatase